MENKIYIAIGEEANRGTAESTTVGFLPLADAPDPKYEPKDEPRKDFRGEDTLLGNTAMRRKSRAWSKSLSIPVYSEAGTVKGITGTVFKHLPGKAVSAQNGATGQYYHMMYGMANPDAAANLGTKALTINENLNAAAVMKNIPWVGGRVKSIEFDQKPGEQLIAKVDLFGQYVGAVVAGIGSIVEPAENLRFDYNGFRLYTGTITRTGTGPDFTQFAFGSAVQIKPDDFKIKIAVAKEDKLRLSGLDYADKTRMGQFEVSGEFTLDWDDPATGFSSYDEYVAYLGGITEISLCAFWDSGTPAGTGDNHSLYIDVPRAVIEVDHPKYDREKDPLCTIKFKGLFDATTCKYLFGLMLKNTATAV